MIWIWAIPIVIGIVFFVWIFHVPPRPQWSDDWELDARGEYYVDDATVTHALDSDMSPRFVQYHYYAWDAIEDLLWATGHECAEVRELRKDGYVSIHRNGVSAAFQYFDHERCRARPYHCEYFDPQSDTGDVDRWTRQPSDDERHRIVWGR